MDDASSSQQLVDTSQSTPNSQNEPITNTMTPSSFFTNDTPSNNGQQASADIAAPSAPVPKPAPTRGGTRGRGRGGRARGKGRVAKAGPKITAAKSSTTISKPGTGRGRRQRAYQYTRAQAAYERNIELRSAYNQLARLAKPVLDEIGSREKKALMENPKIVEEAPEYQEVMGFLDQRRDDTIATSARRLEFEKAMALNVLEGQREAIERSTKQLTAELCEGWYTSMLAEVERLEFLHDNKLPLDLPPAPCTDYTYKDISQKQMDEQGRFAERDDEGDELPCSGKKLSELMTEAYQIHSHLSPKRKADGQPASEPNPKMVKAHTSSLLGGTNTIQGSKSNTPEPGSKAPSPVPFSPSKGGQVQTSLLDPPLPKGAEEPDEYGVRLIQRKDKRAEFHNNRIMVPPVFEFEDDEIGFRDSTNDPVKGATKAKRGRFYMTPNSNYFYLDRRVFNWDSTQVDGELDEEIVKQYGLHPKLGIPLSSSINVDQPPIPHVSGWKPVVLVDPKGQQVHASRTIKAARLDAQGRKFDMMNALHKFCEQEGISEKEIAPCKEEREQKRRQELELRGIDPDQDIESQISQSVTPARVPSPVNTAVFDDFVQGALQAAAADEEAERTAAASRAQPSKPFDAIRDALMDNSTPAPAPQPPSQQPPASIPPQETQVTGFADTTSLSYLADVAERESQEQRYIMHPYHHQGMQSGPPRTYSEAHQESTPIDPSLLPPQSQHNGVPRNSDFERPQHYHHVEYPRPEGYGVYAHQEPHPNDGSRPNDFLRTALNPSAYPPPPESHPGQYQDYSMQGPATGRTPFSNTASSKGLPALRPMHGTPGPDGQVSPVLPPSAHPSMVVSNSGAFYPPAPNRPFHNGYSAQESPVPMQAAVHHPQGMPIQPPPGHAEAHPSQMQMHHYPMPPQPYQNGPIPLAPAPGPMQGPVHIPAASPSPAPGPGHAPPMLQPAPQPHSMAPMPGQPMMPTAGSPPPGRSRPGSSSAPSGPPPPSGASAASNKYRKLEPAPTPPHRLGYTANGQELRTVQFDYREAIKDYTPVEPPPRHGPTHIRGWTHNNLKKGPGANSSRPSSSKGAATTNGVNGAATATTNGDGAVSKTPAVFPPPVVFKQPVIFQAPAPSPIAPQVPTPPPAAPKPAASQPVIVPQGPAILPAPPILKGAADPHATVIPQKSAADSQAPVKPVRVVRTADRSLLVISASAMEKFYRNRSQSATSSSSASSASSASDNNGANDDKGHSVVKEGIEVAAPSPALTPPTKASSGSTKRKRASDSEDSGSSNGPKRVKFTSKPDAAPVSVGDDASSSSAELPQLRPQSPDQQRKPQQKSQQESIIKDTITVATSSSPITAKSPAAAKSKSPTAAKKSPAKTPSKTPAKRKRAAVEIKEEEGSSPSPKRVRIKKENEEPRQRQPVHSNYRLRNRGGPRLEFKENKKGEMELVELGDDQEQN